ncbi:MAG: TIGR03862 family flavoprotein, partial [Akkermansiaceae bacterium]
MPSVGRKFLVAGKSGLNLTHDEAWKAFLDRYSGGDLPDELWRKILTNFDNIALRSWASSLGVETFTASSGKVFPSPINGQIKAAPLLRRWIDKLRALGVTFRMNHRWQGWLDDGSLLFDHRGERFSTLPDATLLALGGGSWKQTGSTGQWVSLLENKNVCCKPLTAANCGWHVDWPREVLDEADGAPLKNLTISAGEASRTGELVITRYGLEGGPIYHLGPALRAMEQPAVVLDLKPSFSEQELIARMGSVTRNFVREARRRWKLSPAACSLLKHLPDRGPWKSPAQLAHEVKACRIPLLLPRPLDEAISSAGGICWEELDESLMIKKDDFK